MKYNQIVTLSRKIRKELGEELTSKKNGYFDWQFYGEEDDNDNIELNFYWTELSPEQMLTLAKYMSVCPYKSIIRGGRHDFANDDSKHNQRYQICLVIFVPQTQK